MPLSAWLQQNEDGLRRYNSFFAILASVFTIIGSIIALFLLWTAKQQITITAKSIQASTMYSIAKDGRELRAQLFDEKEVDYGLVYNYLHSCWHQKRLGFLDEATWEPIENEICGFLRTFPDALSYWDEETKKYFHGVFVSYVEQLGKKPECKK